MGYDWSRFHIGLFLNARPQRVFRAWATAQGLESFFIKKATFTGKDGGVRRADEPAHVGDTYDFQFVHDFRLRGNVLEVSEPQRFKFTFGGSMTVDVEIALQSDGRTRCALTQESIPTEQSERPYSHMNCRSCWIYFLMALKARLEHGIELRDLNPDTADAVSVHFQP